MANEHYIDGLIAELKAKWPWETEFIQAAVEVLESVKPVVAQHPEYEKYRIVDRMIIPERVIIFSVPWRDDKGEYQVNQGFRVQYNSALGPYKGGLRFHPSVNLSILKFLGFEQTFKNALTGLPMGGGKGGSDFNPKGRSSEEMMNFCQSYMRELFRHIGPDTDVPAGDIGVGGREIGYLLGTYKKITRDFQGGVLTGKNVNWGGSLIRPEATGFGAVYFLQEMLDKKGDSIEGKTIALSGFGNVTWGTALKASELGAKVVTIAGPDGYIYDKDGISGEKVDFLLSLRSSNQDIVKPYADKFPGAQFVPGKRPWEVKCDIAMPCAFQNEMSGDDAKALLSNGVKYVVEVSNMGCTPEAMETFVGNKVPFAPGKAANAGGVATSGLEMSQNSLRLQWTESEVDARLHQIMKTIHRNAYDTAKDYGVEGNYVVGANIAGFIKVANAMVGQGVI